MIFGTAPQKSKRIHTRLIFNGNTANRVSAIRAALRRRKAQAQTKQHTISRGADTRIVAMATFPARKAGMLAVVKALLPQCDIFYLYMNGYTARPEELPNDPKLRVILAGVNTGHADLGSHGKFFWLGKDAGYYLSVDDDIHYPPDYVEYMVRMVEKYNRRAIIGIHGGRFRVQTGGAIPAQGTVRKHRVLYGYDKAIEHDIPVHTLGAGVMACYPQALNMSFRQVLTTPKSGDDEDIALYCQKNKIPMVRVAGQHKWVTPNSDIWILQPLHKRPEFLRASEAKIRSWKTWMLQPLPPINTNVKAPAETPRPKPAGTAMSFGSIQLTDADRAFCNKIVSSDALAAMIIDRTKRGLPTSVMRTSDGERALLDLGQGNAAGHAGFLKDAAWLKRYGLEGADLVRVGKDLLTEGYQATFLGCTISGLFIPHFNTAKFYPKRTQFCDVFYPRLWVATDRVGPLLKTAPVLVLHREAAKAVALLKARYGLTDISGMVLDSWKDHKALMSAVTSHHAGIVLVSGGPAGKPFVVRLARETSRTVLDVGESMMTHWATLV